MRRDLARPVRVPNLAFAFAARSRLMGAVPLVSIGLPVYNAERYLKLALDSLVAQDYPNFELIISDNASTDASEKICRFYAEHDARVQYHRAEQNMGAIWNFNRVFELARGDYFMWAAHDDLRDPSYVSTCAAVLQATPEAVLCCTDIRFIDEDGHELQVPPHVAGLRPNGRTPRQRVLQIARACNWYDIYGLARTSALAKTRRAIATWGFDVVVVLELCLRGPVLLVPEPLFSYRLLGFKTQADMAAPLSTQGGIGVCWSCMTIEMLRAIWLAPLEAPARLWLAASFVVNFCVLNWRVAAHLRRDLAHNIRIALSEKRWGRSAVLLVIGALVYPVYNRLTRAAFNRARPTQEPVLRA
jgi:glycosyltransferase involved in cell wall biosynthesis